MNWNGIELPEKNIYFKDGSTVIYCADCKDILPYFEDKSFDLVLTDPPYGLNVLMQGGTWGIKFKHGDMKDWDYLVDQALIDLIITKAQFSIIWGG